MRIALIGYGKMGKAIEEIALERGHEITLRINDQNLGDFNSAGLQGSDLAIEFTGPDTAFDNISSLISWGIPVVSGSTGWIERIEEINNQCRAHSGCFLYASNFSVGVNLFFAINSQLARLMASHSEYAVSMEEIHHTQKKDAPSGTAITLAEQVIEVNPRLTSWSEAGKEREGMLPILSLREDPAPGTHRVKYSSAIDDIEIIHTAHSRKGFATGAVLAAEFCRGKTGIFSMKDVLGL